MIDKILWSIKYVIDQILWLTKIDHKVSCDLFWSILIDKRQNMKRCMVGDKTTVEYGLTKRKPIGYCKISLNPDSVHWSSNKHEEKQKQQNNSLHINNPKNSRKSRLRECQFGLYYREWNRARSNGLAWLNEIMFTISQGKHPILVE